MNIKASFKTKYDTYDLILLYNLSLSKNKEEFDYMFPELTSYRENIFRIVEFSKILSSTEIANSRLMIETLMYIDITNNKDFNYTKEIELVLGKRNNDFCQNLFNYIVLSYPFDLINKDVEEYVLSFAQIESVLYRNIGVTIKKEDVINNQRLYGLVELLENIKKNYHDVFTGIASVAYLNSLVISYCYYKDNGYDLVYSYLDNPYKCIDALIVRGFISYYEPHYYIWNLNGKDNAFKMMEELFEKQKIIIK